MQRRPFVFAALVLASLAVSAGAEAQVREAEVPAAPENPYVGDAEAIAEGKALYMKWGCYGCHGTQGGGGMGPSLTDSLWVYGSTDVEFFRSIHRGRPKGMPGYGDRLSEEEIWKMIAYLRAQGAARK